MRQGLAAAQKRTLESEKSRITLDVKLNLKAEDEKEKYDGEDYEVNKKITLFGPGDVFGINPRIISRVAPPLYTNTFEANYVPFLEFKEPDFLWRFSTRKTEDGKNWIPWLSLIILKAASGEEEAEFVELPNENPNLPSRIQLNANAVLPDLRESWRWAHVHLQDIENDKIEPIIAEIKRNPQKAVCRLMCPRKLEPQRKYHAFLIPTYRIGADVALGFSDSAAGTALTWESPSDVVNQLAYYYQWEFRTGTNGDFEYLVRKLQPRTLENLGTQPMDCSSPGYGLKPEQAEMQLEAALQSLDIEYQAENMEKTIQQDLAALLNQSNDLVVTPPIYGEWHAEVANEDDKLNANKEEWLEEVNLDFRHRAAAGLGVQFVKENQEGLMKAAWEQYNKVKEANRKLNLGRFGVSVSTCLHKRFAQMHNNKVWKMALPLQNKITDTEASEQRSAGAQLKDSVISDKLLEVRVKKYLPQKKVVSPTTNRMVAETTEYFSPILNTQIVSSEFKVQGTNSDRIFQYIGFQFNFLNKKEQASYSSFNKLGGSVKTSLAPKMTIAKPLSNRMERLRKWERSAKKEEKNKNKRSKSNEEEVQLDPILWHPEFHRPLNRFLRELSQEYILAGVEKIPPDTVGLLQTNRRFIEAFMLGANHEFASELRWREFPTDMRGSYFRSFWDTSIYSLDDTEKVAFRATIIGTRLLQNIQKQYGHLKNENGNPVYNTMPKIEATYALGNPNEIEKEIADAYEAAVERWLLTREEDKDIAKITDWSPSTQLGKHPAITYAANQGDTSRLVLVVRGELLQKFSNTLIYLAPKKKKKPDFTKDAKRIFPVFEGKLPPDMVFVGFPISEEEARENKHFLVFEERMTDLRFGLDIEKEGSEIKDFSWEHFSIEEGDYLDAQAPEIFASDWNSAAFIGRTMLQKQVRVAVELEAMLPPEE